MKKSSKTLTMNYPARWWSARWRETLPMGNGEMGAALYGGVFRETIMLTHTDLWWKSSTPELPDVSEHLPLVRQLLQENKAREADTVFASKLREAGYDPKISHPLPLGDLKIVQPQQKAFKNYNRELDMDKGEVSVSWSDGDIPYVRKCFVSRADDLFVCSISSPKKETPIKAEISMERHDTEDTKRFRGGPVDILPEQCETLVKDHTLCYAARNDDGTDFGALLTIFPGKGTVTSEKDSLTVESTGEILILGRLFIRGERANDWTRLKAELDEIPADYQTLLTRHRSLHEPLMNSASLELYGENHDKSSEELLMDSYKGEMPTALTEKMWNYGRYLLVASSREGGNPCHLYGLWCGEYMGMWAFNMINENIQMIYWHALSGNMPELLLAVFDYYERLMDDFRENAMKLYGCRGIYIPAPTSPDSGLLKTISPHIIHWTGGAGWLAQHYYDYYLHTGDEEFLKNRALPFMVEAALFYEDFFEVDEKGYFISNPSNSPENTPSEYWDGEGMGSSMETTINATMDFAIARELLTNLLNGAQKAGLHKDDWAKWEDMIGKIPPYEINPDGAVREWMHPFFSDNYHHRHESHLYPVFPGTEVTEEDDPELFAAFKKAVEKRLVIGLKQQSGWSLAHMANNYARMGQGDQALECLEIMSRSCLLDNLMTTHNDWRDMGIGVDLAWAPIQLDANMGWCSAVNEMLLYSRPGLLKIIPALPRKWQAGKVCGLLARGGIEVSLEWDENNLSVELEPKRTEEVMLIMPPTVETGTTKVKLTAGEKHRLSFVRRPCKI